jgi:UDP-N-acetylglucosamine diphosphorylase/glucosamine-1-phosphate N-acetyltransferase
MKVVLFDDPEIRRDLLPFTFTRPVAGIRVGIYTIAEKWQKYLKADITYKTQKYLEGKFPPASDPESLFINGAVCPTIDLYEAVVKLRYGQALVQDKTVLAYIGEDLSEELEFTDPLTIIRKNYDIFLKNGEQIRADFELVKASRVSSPITDKHTIVYNESNVFVEPGVVIRAAVLNAEHGPIYIGKNAEIQEGSVIRGPFALGEGSVLNMGAKLRGDVSIGPFCKVGGEVSASVIFGYSNKGHEGFIGNTVIGEWCNLGADTNTSNLKNNYSNVSIWSYKAGKMVDTGLQFCGLMMGDHSKTSINTMLNTGTVAGVSANIFGGGFPPKFIPSFSWGGAEGLTTFKLDKSFEVAEKVMKRRGIELTEEDRKILSYLFEESNREQTQIAAKKI